MKPKDLEENLRIKYRNYVKKDDKLLLGFVRFLNQKCSDFCNFWEDFHKMAERKYLQVFPDYYTSIFYLFPFFDNHIALVKYGV